MCGLEVLANPENTRRFSKEKPELTDQEEIADVHLATNTENGQQIRAISKWGIFKDNVDCNGKLGVHVQVEFHAELCQVEEEDGVGCAKQVVELYVAIQCKSNICDVQKKYVRDTRGRRQVVQAVLPRGILGGLLPLPERGPVEGQVTDQGAVARVHLPQD